MNTDGDAPLDPDARDDRLHNTVTPVVPTRETNANRPSAQSVDRAPSGGHPSIMAPFVAPPPPLRHPHASRSSSRSHMPQLVMREPSRRMPASAPQDPILNEFRASPGGRELPELPRPDDEDGYMMAVPDEERRATSSAAPSSVPVPQEGIVAPSRAEITRERHRPADAPASSPTASSSYYSPSPGSGQQILTARQPSAHALPNFSTPSQVQEEHRSSGSSPGRDSPRGVSSRKYTITSRYRCFHENRIFLPA
jgi:hypothetical protein